MFIGLHIYNQKRSGIIISYYVVLKKYRIWDTEKS